MTVQRTRDVLERAREFHRQLGAFYHDLESKTDRPRVKLLLDYMSLHEERLDAFLEKYEQVAEKGVLNAWLQNVPELAACKCFEQLHLSPDMTADEVVRIALGLDECLVKLYETVAQQAPSTDVKELFQELLEQVRKEDRQLVRDALELEDT